MCTTIAIKTDKHRHVVSQYADHSHPVTNIQYNKHVSVYFLPLHTQDGEKKIQTNRFESKRAGQQHFVSSYHNKGKCSSKSNATTHKH